MKLPATAGIFIYIFEIYMKMPATAGNFIYISWSQGHSIRHGQNDIYSKADAPTIRPSPTTISWLPVLTPQDQLLIKLVHSSEKKLVI